MAMVKTTVKPQVRSTRSICGFLTMHWAAEDHGFRALVEPDGAVVWPTCAKNSRSCVQPDPSAPPTNGPVCCAYLIKTVLVQLVTALRRHKVNLFLLSGTLLAAARNQKVIPWDADCDVAIIPGLHPIQWHSQAAMHTG